MNLETLRAVLRLEYLDDAGAQPFLWQDFQLDRFINEACSEAARRSHCVQERLHFALTAGQSALALPPSTLYVLSARIGTGGRLSHLALSDLERLPHWEGRSGRPCGFVFESTHEGGEGTLTLYPRPTQPHDLNLRVARLPRTLVDNADAPMIPAALHPHLLDYAASRAFALRDADAGDRELAARHLTRFERQFGTPMTPDVRAARQSGARRQIALNPDWRA